MQPAPFRTIRHDAIDSTSSEALRRVRDGSARHGDVHVARTQSSGHGRQGRRWLSPPGEGLYATAVWFADGAAPPSGAAVTMAAGLAVRDALVALGTRGVALDWPNDAEVDGAKIAGILVESVPRDGGVALAVGVGINVRQRDFDEELARERPVTSLALVGVDATVDDALRELLRALAPRLAQAVAGPRDALAHDFGLATGLLGREVVARFARRDGPEEVRGRLLAIDFERGVAVETPRGVASCALEHVRSLDPADGAPRALAPR
ncbi:MAG: biotin--[acetyl-CoA-carboxylase] ligase [Planctomycetota bacterium]